MPLAALCCICRKLGARRLASRDLLTPRLLVLIPSLEVTPVLSVNDISDRLFLRALSVLLCVFEKSLDQVSQENTIVFAPGMFSIEDGTSRVARSGSSLNALSYSGDVSGSTTTTAGRI